jgi:CheY-like chemotaxis protein
MAYPPLPWFFAPEEEDDHPRSRSQKNRADPHSGKRPLLVLVADDEPVIAETLVEILNDEGFQAVSVHDGASAVETVSVLHPDIVLTDVSMPRLNGIEAAKQIRAISPGTRIVLFSGQAETAELLADAERAGYVFEVLAKPVKPATLIKTLRTAASE